MRVGNLLCQRLVEPGERGDRVGWCVIDVDHATVVAAWKIWPPDPDLGCELRLVLCQLHRSLTCGEPILGAADWSVARGVPVREMFEQPILDLAPDVHGRTL